MQKVTLIVVLFLLSGCALIPGSNLTGLSFNKDDPEKQQMEQDLAAVNIQMIDSKLVAQMKQETAQQEKFQPSAAAETVDTDNYKYRLGIGDVLSIGVWDHPELTIPAAVQRTATFDGFRVQADGTITFAYAPDLQAAGKTVAQLRADLTEILEDIIEEPQIDIKVIGFNSQKVYITGEVKKPGVYPVTEIPMTILDAVNQAGGLTEQANWSDVVFSRGEQIDQIRLDRFYQNGDISQNRLLQHGDIIHVNRIDHHKVFVLGDVVQARSVEVGRYGLSLAEALTEAGGLDENSANANGIFVLRKRDLQQDGVIADVYQLHAKNAVALVFANQFELQPQDIVYVTAAPLARWNRLITQLLPTVTAGNTASEIKSRENLF